MKQPCAISFCRGLRQGGQLIEECKKCAHLGEHPYKGCYTHRCDGGLLCGGVIKLTDAPRCKANRDPRTCPMAKVTYDRLQGRKVIVATDCGTCVSRRET